MRKLSPGLFYVFCDETYAPIHAGKRYIMGYILVPQVPWSRLPESKRSLSEPGNITGPQRLKQLLNDVGGVATITYADLGFDLIVTGERDGTADIPDMARTDNAWSAAMAFCLAAALKWPLYHDLSPQTVDVYYDTRSINSDHRAALHNAIKNRLSWIMRDEAKRKSIPRGYGPRIRRFVDTEKAAQNCPANKYQQGIAATDRLLKFYKKNFIYNSNEMRIHVMDHSTHVRGHISKFQVP